MSVNLKSEFSAILSSIIMELLSDDDEEDLLPVVAIQEGIQNRQGKDITEKKKKIETTSSSSVNKALKEARYLQKSRFENVGKPTIHANLDEASICTRSFKNMYGQCMCPDHIERDKMREVSVLVIQKGRDSSLSDMDFKLHWKMSKTTMEILYSLVNPLDAPIIVSPMELLTVMWKMVTNEPIEQMESRFCLNKAEIQNLERKVLEKICNARTILEVWPNGAAVNLIMNCFNSISGLSAQGALASVHFQCTKAPFNPKNFIDSLGNTSIAIQLVSDHRGSFIHNSYFFWPGSQDPVSIYESTKLKKFPMSENSFLVGGAAYSNVEQVVTPYRLPKLTQEQSDFNARHSLCMRVLEEAVLKLASRFKLLTSLPMIHSVFVRQLLCSCVLIHNLCNDLLDEVDIDPSLQVEHFFPLPTVPSKKCEPCAKRDRLCQNIALNESELERNNKRIKLDIPIGKVSLSKKSNRREI